MVGAVVMAGGVGGKFRIFSAKGSFRRIFFSCCWAACVWQMKLVVDYFILFYNYGSLWMRRTDRKESFKVK